MDNSITINNAPWWLPNSYVRLKGQYLAEDDAWVTNTAIDFKDLKSGNPTMKTRQGEQPLFKIQRMVTDGVVSVLFRGGIKSEVRLPKDVGKLSTIDAVYIINEIDAMSQPMSVEEQEAFLASVNAQSEGNSTETN